MWVTGHHEDRVGNRASFWEPAAGAQIQFMSTNIYETRLPSSQGSDPSVLVSHAFYKYLPNLDIRKRVAYVLDKPLPRLQASKVVI